MSLWAGWQIKCQSSFRNELVASGKFDEGNVDGVMVSWFGTTFHPLRAAPTRSTTSTQRLGRAPGRPPTDGTAVPHGGLAQPACGAPTAGIRAASLGPPAADTRVICPRDSRRRRSRRPTAGPWPPQLAPPGRPPPAHGSGCCYITWGPTGCRPALLARWPDGNGGVRRGNMATVGAIVAQQNLY